MADSGSGWTTVNGIFEAQKSQNNAKERRARFQNRTKADHSVVKPKYTKLSQAQDYFKETVNVDINKYRDNTTKMFDKRSVITLDYKSMPKTVQQAFNRALISNASPYTAYEMGSWGVQLVLKKK